MNQATCPVCNGNIWIPCEPKDSWMKDFKYLSYYDPLTNTKQCRNCGGQTMFGVATGMTNIDPNTGLGCVHEYNGEKRGNCYHVYTCKHGCGFQYDIDSGD